MVGLWRGEGGIGRRLLGEVVPVLVGLSVGAFAGPFLGLVGGIVVGLAAAALVSALLVRVRRHRTARRVYRVLLVLHVLFWTAMGLAGSVPEPAPSAEEWAAAPGTAASGRDGGSPGALDRVRWPGGLPLRAGVGEVRFALPPEATLAGWGGPPRRRRWPAFAGLGVVGRASLATTGAPREGAAPRAPLFVRPDRPGEPLGARALVLVPDGPRSLDVPAVAVVRLDLITLDPDLPAAVLARVRDRVKDIAFDPRTLLLAATHTHTGPGGGMRAAAATMAGTDHFDSRVFDAVAETAASAIAKAAESAVPSRIALFGSRDRDAAGVPILAENRSSKDDRIDDRVLGLRVESIDPPRSLGVLVNYAVMPVLLRKHHMAFARDVPGAIEDALQTALHGDPLVLFVNGATGDVSPKRTFGKGEAGVLGLARAFAERIQDDVRAPRAHDRLRVTAVGADLDLGSAHAFVAMGDRAAFDARVVRSAFGEDLPSALAAAVSLPVNALAWSLGLTEVRLGFTFDGAAGALVNLEGRAGPRRHRVGVLLLEIGDPRVRHDRSCWLWQGGIPTQAVGKRWRQAVEARGFPPPLLFALTNDAASYIVTPDEYDRSSYESRASLFGREAALRLEAVLGAGVDAARGDEASGGAWSPGG